MRHRYDELREDYLVGSAGLSQQTDVRRKRITWLVAALLAVAALGVVWAYWSRRARKEVSGPAPPTLPTNVNRQLSGYTYTRSEGGRRIFTVHAARTLAFEKGDATVLEDVYVEVYGSTEARHDVMRTERCDYNSKSGELFAAGKVSIELNDLPRALPAAGLPPGRATRNGPEQVFLETSKVSLKQQGSILTSSEVVKFRTSNAAGTGRGFAYATRTGSLELNNDVELNLHARGGRQPLPATKLTASRLRFDKEKGEIDLGGPIQINQAGSTVNAGRGTIQLEGIRRVSQAQLEDGVRAVEHTAGRTMNIGALRIRASFDRASGALRSLLAEGKVEGEARGGGKVSRLAAERLQLVFTGIHPQPVNGIASGSVRLSGESAPGTKANAAQATSKDSLGAARQELTAAQVKFLFRPKQQTLEQAQTVGMGHLLLVPASAEMGTREVFAEPLVMDFDPRGRLEVLRGLARSKVISQPAKKARAGTPVSQSTSDRLKATFDRATGTLSAMEQSGNFQFTEGDRKSSAEQALYEAKKQQLTLTGRPQVSDAEISLRADRIVMDMQSSVAEGFGHVQSTQVKTAGQSASAGQAAPLGKNAPTNVVADRVLARRASQFVHYEGHVHAWHGQDVVESPALDIYKSERKISSTAGVFSSFVQSGPVDAKSTASGAAHSGSRPVTIRAERLEYSDEAHKAVYQGKVELRTEDTTLRSDRLDVYFVSKSGNESSALERALAEGHVTIVQPTRHATAEHAEYLAAPGKIVLTGGPPAVYDASEGSTTGRSLTLFLHDDTILVDGGDKSPTLSKHRISP